MQALFANACIYIGRLLAIVVNLLRDRVVVFTQQFCNACAVALSCAISFVKLCLLGNNLCKLCSCKLFVASNNCVRCALRHGKFGLCKAKHYKKCLLVALHTYAVIQCVCVLHCALCLLLCSYYSTNESKRKHCYIFITVCGSVRGVLRGRDVRPPSQVVFNSLQDGERDRPFYQPRLLVTTSKEEPFLESETCK